MSIEKFHSLVSRICEHYQAPLPRNAYQSACVSVQGSNFTLFHGGILVPDAVLMHCDFGELPSFSREEILLRLMQENGRLFDMHGTAFSYDPLKNRVTLMCRLPFMIESGSAAVQTTIRALDYFAVIAARWKRDYFLFSRQQTVLHSASTAA